VLEGLQLDLGSIDGDLIRLYPIPGGPLDGVNSVAGASPQLLEVAGIYQEEKPDVISDNAHRAFLANNAMSHIYLSSQQYLQPARTLNANTAYEFDLDQFDHLSAGLVVIFRRSNRANATNDFQVFGTLGDGTIDVLSVAGESVFGGGRAVRADYLKDIINAKDWGTDYFRQNFAYLIPFGEFDKALVGAVDGLLDINGQKMRLRIETPSTWANANYDVYIYSLFYRLITQVQGNLIVEDLN
jgi:hypothetical protein